MHNNSPPSLSLSLFWRFNFQNHLPATYLLRVCLYHPVNNQPAKPICHPHLPQRRPSFVTASRPATLINAHHRLTTLPPSTFWPPLLCACLSLAPSSSLLFSPLIRFRRASFVPRRTFCSSQLSNNFADRGSKTRVISCDRKLHIAAVFPELVFCCLSSKVSALELVFCYLSSKFSALELVFWYLSSKFSALGFEKGLKKEFFLPWSGQYIGCVFFFQSFSSLFPTFWAPSFVLGLKEQIFLLWSGHFSSCVVFFESSNPFLLSSLWRSFLSFSTNTLFALSVNVKHFCIGAGVKIKL